MSVPLTCVLAAGCFVLKCILYLRVVCCEQSFNCLNSKHQSCLLSAVNGISTIKIQNTRPIYCLLCAVFPPLKFKTPDLFIVCWVQSFHKLNSKYQDYLLSAVCCISTSKIQNTRPIYCLLGAVFPQVKFKVPRLSVICCVLYFHL